MTFLQEFANFLVAMHLTGLELPLKIIMGTDISDSLKKSFRKKVVYKFDVLKKVSAPWKVFLMFFLKTLRSGLNPYPILKSKIFGWCLADWASLFYKLNCLSLTYYKLERLSMSFFQTSLIFPTLMVRNSEGLPMFAEL